MSDQPLNESGRDARGELPPVTRSAIQRAVMLWSLEDPSAKNRLRGSDLGGLARSLHRVLTSQLQELHTAEGIIQRIQIYLMRPAVTESPHTELARLLDVLPLTYMEVKCIQQLVNAIERLAREGGEDADGG